MFIIIQKGGWRRLVIIFTITTFKCDKQNIDYSRCACKHKPNETTCVLEIYYIPPAQEKIAELLKM